MLDKSISIDGQDNIVVNGTKDSTINISQTEKMVNVTGNVSIGMSYMDVKDLCQTLIKTEVNRLTQEAQEEFHKRLEEFEQKFYEKLAKVEPSNIEKLKKPSLQLCLHETILSSMKTEDEHTKEQLQEMLIDRLNIDENMTDKAIIEDAIEKATKVSKPMIALMVALQFRTFIMGGGFKQSLDYSFGQMGELFKALKYLTNLDIAYGCQLQCFTNFPFMRQAANFDDILLRNYDLYFRHAMKFRDYMTFRNSHPEIQHVVKLGNIEGMSMICIDGSKSDVLEQDREVTFMAASSYSLRNTLKEQEKEYMIPAMNLMLMQMPAFTKKELKEYLVGLNVGWHSFFEICDRFQVNQLQLTPVGNYLALVYAKRITQLPDDFLQQIYENINHL